MSETASPAAAMVDVNGVAKLVMCSTRTIYRLIEEKKIPAPTKICTLNRWPAGVIDTWISAGCPPQLLVVSH
jgi:excisionase family DNA binding protein